jgi:hypothetical protein
LKLLSCGKPVTTGNSSETNRGAPYFNNMLHHNGNSLNSSGANSSSSSRILPKSVSMFFQRDRLNALYYRLFTPLTQASVLVFSVFLLLVALFHRGSLMHEWYHWCEGIITFLFVLEISLRLSVMRAGFWDTSMNLVEVMICFFCVAVFLLLSFAHHTTRMEHTVLVFLRFIAQLIRIVTAIRSGGSSTYIASTTTFSVYSAGGGVGTCDEV